MALPSIYITESCVLKEKTFGHCLSKRGGSQ